MNSLSNSEWTFGIISGDVSLTENGDIIPNSNNYLFEVVQSIYRLNIPKDKFEIIIVGGNNQNKDFKYQNTTIINFDELTKPKWITKKKNLIIDKAQFENIAIVHDYASFDENWYTGFEAFDTDWDVCMVKIFNKDGVRWRDWILWWCGTAPYRLEHKGVLLEKNRLLYDDTRFTNTDMYINGTVIIGKNTFLKNNKLDENLCWGQGEDCEWSARCRPFWKYKMNPNSKINLLKQQEQ